MAISEAKGSYKLVTVNTAPERAERLISRVADRLKERHVILHVDNESTPDNFHFPQIRHGSKTCIEMYEVERKVEIHQPDF